MDKLFENQMRKKLEHYREEPPKTVWAGIKKKAKVSIPKSTKWLWKLGAAFLVLSGALLFILWLNNKSSSANDIQNSATTISPPDTIHPESYLRGATLFQNYCATCHDKDLITATVGPALFNITERRSMDWLSRFTRNAIEMIRSKDSIALEVWLEWQPTVMNPFPNLTDQEIEDIYYFIEQKSKRYE